MTPSWQTWSCHWPAPHQTAPGRPKGGVDGGTRGSWHSWQSPGCCSLKPANQQAANWTPRQHLNHRTDLTNTPHSHPPTHPTHAHTHARRPTRSTRTTSRTCFSMPLNSAMVPGLMLTAPSMSSSASPGRVRPASGTSRALMARSRPARWVGVVWLGWWLLSWLVAWLGVGCWGW